MKILISCAAFWPLFCPLFLAHAQAPTSPLLTAYHKAVNEAEAAHQTQKTHLVEFYVKHLGELARSAQQEGDLESLIVLKAEQQATQAMGKPPEEIAAPAIKPARDAFRSHAEKLEKELSEKKASLDATLLANLEGEISRLTRAGQIEEAKTLQELQEELQTKLAAASPTPTAGENLGPNLFPNGSFDDAPEKAWRINSPGGRNKSGLYQEPNSGMNQVLRLEQVERGNSRARHTINVKAGNKYRIRWRTRLLRPWRSGIELRGKGQYQMGFRIPNEVWNPWPEAERKKQIRQVIFSRPPPDEREWQWMEADLTIRNSHQVEFFIIATRGEGDFLIDDIEIREILGPEKKP